ncbi:MAG: hypothetical protein ACREFZ_12110, partial [Acetobacteraceae bacterium]
SKLLATKHLPSLEGTVWQVEDEGEEVLAFEGAGMHSANAERIATEIYDAILRIVVVAGALNTRTGEAIGRLATSMGFPAFR